jgi:hypothetical protein
MLAWFFNWASSQSQLPMRPVLATMLSFFPLIGAEFLPSRSMNSPKTGSPTRYWAESTLTVRVFAAVPLAVPLHTLLGGRAGAAGAAHTAAGDGSPATRCASKPAASVRNLMKGSPVLLKRTSPGSCQTATLASDSHLVVFVSTRDPCQAPRTVPRRATRFGRRSARGRNTPLARGSNVMKWVCRYSVHRRFFARTCPYPSFAENHAE